MLGIVDEQQFFSMQSTGMKITSKNNLGLSLGHPKKQISASVEIRDQGDISQK